MGQGLKREKKIEKKDGRKSWWMDGQGWFIFT